MKTRLLFATAILIIAAFASCGKAAEGIPDDGKQDGGDSDKDRQAVNFYSVITRASGTSWDAGDKIGVFMVNHGTTTLVDNVANKLYTNTGSGSFSATAENRIYFPVSGNKVDFISYYPYHETIPMTIYEYSISTGDQSSQAALDFMYSNNAVNKDGGNPNVQLNFNHKLCKLYLNISAGQGVQASDLTTMDVTIKGMKIVAAIDLSTGEITSKSNYSDIIPRKITAGSKYEAIILPMTVANKGDITVEFALNNAQNDLYIWPVPGGTIFESGKECTWDIVLSGGAAVEVSVTATINPWAAGTSGSGTAEQSL